jgi:Domain of unknown function (DUF4437)
MWNRPNVDFVQSQDVPTAWAEPGTFGSAGGGVKQILSHDPESGAETFLLRVADVQQGVVASAVDVYVLGGEGLLNGERLRTGDYVYVPAGSNLDLRPSVAGLKLYCGFWGAPTLTEADGAAADLLRLRPETMRWQQAGWSGDVELEPGVAVKTLRQDEGAFVYLAAMMPGWKCELEESHPVYEESFKVYGDVLMGARGVIRAGGYFFRSPHVFHGPLYSRGGTMSFIRSDGPTSTEYREPPAEETWDALAARAHGE